jgi:uncharacterized membrane protein
MGENNFESGPTALYGIVLIMAAIAYFILQHMIIKKQGKDSILAAAIGKDLKGKISPVIYAVAIPFAFINQWVSGCLYVLVAFIWLIPDKRIEKIFSQ